MFTVEERALLAVIGKRETVYNLAMCFHTQVRRASTIISFDHVDSRSRRSRVREHGFGQATPPSPILQLLSGRFAALLHAIHQCRKQRRLSGNFEN